MYSYFILCDKKHREYAIEDVLETHYIVLPKFRKKLKQGSINLADPKDRIILLLNKDTPQDLAEKVIGSG